MVSTVGDDSQADVLLQGEAPAACSNLFLDLVGEVALSLDSEGLSWKSVGSRNDVCFSAWLSLTLIDLYQHVIEFLVSNFAADNIPLYLWTC